MPEATGSRRSRDITVLVAIGGALALLGAVAAYLWFQDGDDGGAEPRKDPTPTVEPAIVEESFQDACDALVDEGIRGKGAKGPAEADKDEIEAAYLDPDGGGPVVGIALTVCDRGWVIVVGVDEPTAVVPSVGTNGTPVIAYLEETGE